MARVKVVVDYFYTVYSDGRWKNIVQRNHQVPFWNGRIEPDRSHLGQGVNPGIRSAGSLRQDIFTSDASKAISKNALYGRETGLNLPPVEL